MIWLAGTGVTVEILIWREAVASWNPRSPDTWVLLLSAGVLIDHKWKGGEKRALPWAEDVLDVQSSTYCNSRLTS